MDIAERGGCSNGVERSVAELPNETGRRTARRSTRPASTAPQNCTQPLPDSVDRLPGVFVLCVHGAGPNRTAQLCRARVRRELHCRNGFGETTLEGTDWRAQGARRSACPLRHHAGSSLSRYSSENMKRRRLTRRKIRKWPRKSYAP